MGRTDIRHGLPAPSASRGRMATAESLHHSDHEPADLVHESHRPTHRKTQDWQLCVMGDTQHKGK